MDARDDEGASLHAIAVSLVARVDDCFHRFHGWLEHGPPSAPSGDRVALLPSSAWIAHALDAAALRELVVTGHPRIVAERSLRRVLLGKAERAAGKMFHALAVHALRYEPTARDVHDAEVAARVLEAAMRELGAEWDRFAAVVAATGVERSRALRATLRALLPELAIRRAALLSKAGASNLGRETLFADRPFGACVDHLLARIGYARDDLIAQGIERGTFGDRALRGWCSGNWTSGAGSPPSNRMVHALARAFIRLEKKRGAVQMERRAPWVEAELRTYLRVARAAQIFRNALEAEIGQDALRDLSQALNRLTALAMDAMRHDAIEDGVLLAMIGPDRARANEALREQATWHQSARALLTLVNEEKIEDPTLFCGAALAAHRRCGDEAMRDDARRALRAAALEAMVFGGARCIPGLIVCGHMIDSLSGDSIGDKTTLRDDIAAVANRGWQRRALTWLAIASVLERVAAEAPSSRRQQMEQAIDGVLRIVSTNGDGGVL